jgi:CubicO group peptidase (beta-lactamase class C family)
MTSPEISSFLQERIDANDFPSAVYLVAEKGEILFQDALGFAVVEPLEIEARLDTIYDLASLTKPLVIGPLIAAMVDAGESRLDDPLSDILDAPRDKRDITVRDLLTHTSRLPAWLPFYLRVGERSAILDEILNTPLVDGPAHVIYSDLNFLLLAEIATRILGRPLDRLAAEYIFEPLQLKDTFYNPPEAVRLRTAASENGNAYERQTCIELGYLPDPQTFRDYRIWGQVHDGNAWFMGGVSGHAGLFSTAEETFKIAQQFLQGHTRLLSVTRRREFSTNFTSGMNEHRSLAFQLASTPDSTAGRLMSPEAFGHLGFTGTSLWIDPVTERVFILLTNRTHAHSLPFANINSVRRRFHDLANELLY